MKSFGRSFFWCDIYVPLIYLEDVFSCLGFSRRDFPTIPSIRIPSRASTDDFDWLEFARCAADFGPLPTSASAVDRLRLALKHYVLQTLVDGGAVQEVTKEVEAKTMKNVRMFNNCLIMIFIDLRSLVLLLSLG